VVVWAYLGPLLVVLRPSFCLLSGLVRSSGSESAFAPRGVRRPASPLRASRDEDPILRMDMIWSIWGYLWTTSLARLGKAHLLYHTCKRKQEFL